MVKEHHHPLLVFEDERVNHLHVGLLDAKLYQVGQILQAFGDHDQRSGGCRWRLL